MKKILLTLSIFVPILALSNSIDSQVDKVWNQLEGNNLLSKSTDALNKQRTLTSEATDKMYIDSILRSFTIGAGGVILLTKPFQRRLALLLDKNQLRKYKMKIKLSDYTYYPISTVPSTTTGPNGERIPVPPEKNRIQITRAEQILYQAEQYARYNEPSLTPDEHYRDAERRGSDKFIHSRLLTTTLPRVGVLFTALGGIGYAVTSISSIIYKVTIGDAEVDDAVYEMLITEPLDDIQAAKEFVGTSPELADGELGYMITHYRTVEGFAEYLELPHQIAVSYLEKDPRLQKLLIYYYAQLVDYIDVVDVIDRVNDIP